MDDIALAYDALAAEFYQADKHPTTANLREASDLALGSWLRGAPPSHGIVVEVGAGMSTVCRLQTGPHGLLVLTDVSARMLEQSRRFASGQVWLLVSDASRLPFVNGSVGLLVAALGSPYNHLAFWREARRVLAPEGQILFSAPAYESACDRETAAFDMRSGTKLRVGSIKIPEAEQRDLISAAGLWVEGDFRRVRVSDIRNTRLSPQFVGLDSATPVVVGIRCSVPRGYV